MGVLNVTPDSFSDGGEFTSVQAAVDRALKLIADGAGIIDIGPESTRPGSEPVPAEEQIARAIPVIEAIRARDDRVALSIDTRLAPVARAALEAGADIVNDISALRDDPAMGACIARFGATVVLMHMRGTPADMQAAGGPHYTDVLGELSAFLEARRAWAVEAGIDPSRMIFDPGIGFGKRVEDNLAILGRIESLVSLGQPLLIGASRKSFLGRILGIEDPKARLAGSLACAAIAARSGASIVRAHDVRETVEVVRVCAAVERRAASPIPSADKTHRSG
jgi:dihydropteroate synthase